MTKHIVSEERVRLGKLQIECNPSRFLRMQGLPRRMEWSFPATSRYADHHVVDFSLLVDPKTVHERLMDDKIPEWFLHCHEWENLLEIGTWITTSKISESTTELAMCVDCQTGYVFQLEFDPVEIQISLDSQRELAAGSGINISESHLLNLAKSQCLVFVNSSPELMEDCFELYFSLIDTSDISVGVYLQNVIKVDPPAGKPGALWNLLVADYLQADEEY